jgi:carbonic anhydrase
VVAREGAGIRRPAANGQAARLEIPAYETPFGPPRTLLDVNNIVICGHADCEPVKGAMSPESVEPLPYGGPWLEYVDTGQTHDLDDAIEANVLAQLDHLRTYDFISEAIAAGSLALSGCV